MGVIITGPRRAYFGSYHTGKITWFDIALRSETAPPRPISAPASSPAPPPTPTEHTHDDTTSAPDKSEASRIVIDAEEKIHLRLDGKNGFLPSNASTQEMSDVVKLMYDTPWLSYGMVPIEVKDRWFNKWMENFYFEEGANLIVIRKTFNYHMGRIFQQMLRKRRSATNKVNRASAKGGLLHCGGSVTIPSTQKQIAKELNREPTIAEVFKQTLTRKRNKEEWVDERSERLNDVFIAELETRTQATQQSAHEGNDSNSSVIVNLDEVWREVVGEPRKNRIYGIGSYFSRTLRTDPLLRSSRGTRSQHTVEELRTQIHGLTQELRQKVQQNEENEERVQQLLTQAELKMNATVEQARERARGADERVRGVPEDERGDGDLLCKYAGN
ncbi:hypothetical protein PIB30_087473 [Stylosanthes scabra]|uniref:Uncharacterized protein n=1 Tax=Stylosanthes scabra TaxID=79078 RepID=A0ABU6RUA7_9FABA|nr:hypothetical protein [Stylosanthes scabra]